MSEITVRDMILEKGRKHDMTYGINAYEDICGIEKVININPQFSWNDVRYIEKLDYCIDIDEYAEQVSNLKILFLIELPDKVMHKLFVKFSAINNLYINNIGGKYNQIVGFEIMDQLTAGWELEQRYVVRDYENRIIEFNCKSIEILGLSSECVE